MAKTPGTFVGGIGNSKFYATPAGKIVDEAGKPVSDRIAAMFAVTPPAETTAKKKKVGKLKIAGVLGNTKYYYAENGTVIDDKGQLAPERIAKLFDRPVETSVETKRSAIKQAISTNLVPSAISFGKPVKTIIARNELLMNSIVNNQLKTSLEYPKMFGALESTVRTLSVAAEITARKIHENNREFHEALLAKLTGEKTPTRAAGATKTIPKSRPGKAPARTPLSRGGPPTSIAGRRAAERAQGIPKQRSAEVLARAERFAQIRRTRMARGALIGGAAGIAGGAIAGGLYDAFGKAFGGGSQASAGGAAATPSGAERTTPSPQRQQQPGGTERSEAPDRPQAGGTTLSGVVDLTSQTQGYFNFGSLQGRQGFIIHHTAGRGTAAGIINVFKQRNFPTQFIIDREGKIYQVLPSGRRGQHMKNGEGVGAGLSNANTEGVEVIAKDDSDILPVQVEAAKRLAQMLGYAPNQVYGHGEVNSHKQKTEGATIIRAIRGNAPPLAAGQRAEAATATLNAEAPNATGAATGQPIAGGRNQSGREIGRPSAGLNAEKEKLIRETAARFGMNPNALTGILNIESGGTFNPATRGGASNRYYGIFQLQDSQIPGLTRTALGQSLTPEQYQQRSFADQLKVYEQYIKNAGVSAGFFTGDASKDASRLWALQLAPGNARRLNYDDPNTVISRSRQAAAISAEPGLVTVGSVQRETLRRGGLEGGVAAAPGAATGEPVAGGRNQPAAPAAAPGAPTAQQPGQQQQSVAGFSMPVDGARLSSGFGQRWGRLHAGLDFAAPTGTPVKAAAPGVVVRATPAGAYGNLVEIRHADGTHTRYAHLSAFNTTQGATVSQGQVIGAVGSTGRSTGPHLHFEIRRNGGSSPVDPRPLLGGAAPTVQGDQAKTSTEPGVVQPSAGSPRTRGTPAAAPSTSGTPMSMPSGLPGNDLFGLSSMFGMMGMGRPGMSGGMLAILPLIMRNNVVVNRKRQASGEVPFNMTSAPINPVAGMAGLFGQVFRGF